MIIKCWTIEDFTAIIAGLVKEGIMFEASFNIDGESIITCTGGY